MNQVRIIDEIRNKADIVEVIGHYLKLVKAGSNYKAVCPFHDDTRPSLSISTSKQIYKCFVCNSGGNCFTFVQKYEHVSFWEAVKKVCEICHIEVPEINTLAPEKPKEHSELYQVIKEAAGFYHFSLRQSEGQDALKYLNDRNMTDDVIDHFNIGHAPSDNTRLIKLLRERYKYSIETLQEAGILAQSSSGFYDRYRNRIIFPLENIQGDIVGFSGRIYKDIDHNEAKYVNSPETSIFRKSDILYNYKNARETCRKEGFLYILEGFMDVIALYKAGINSAVALMGTALTQEHIELFRKLNVEIRLCLDGDEAGQSATFRSSQLLTNSGIKYKIVETMQDGKDPDEILNSNGKEGLVKALNTLEEPILFEIKFLLSHGHLLTLEQKEAFIDSKMVMLKSYDSLMLTEIVQQVAVILKLSSDNLSKKIETSTVSPKRESPKPQEYMKDSSTPDEKLVNYHVLNDHFWKFERITSNDNKRMKQLCSLESCLLVKMYEHREAYVEFQKRDGIFLVDMFNDFVGYLGNYYHSHLDREHLEFQDYQIMLDGLNFTKYSDKIMDNLTYLLQCMQICRTMRYSLSSFLNTLENQTYARKMYILIKFGLNESSLEYDEEKSKKALSQIEECKKLNKTIKRKNGEN